MKITGLFTIVLLAILCSSLIGLVAANQFTFSIDPGSIAVQPGGSAAYSLSNIGNDGTVTLSYTGGLPTGATYLFSPNNQCPQGGSRTLTITTSTSGPTGSFTFTIHGVGGSKNHDVTGIVIVDNTNPTGSVSINSAATYATSTSVSLGLTYGDGSGSGVKDVRYSNDGVWDTETFESAAATKAWTLTSGDGTKTVYYQIRDKAGLLSSTYSDIIILDSVAPSSSATVGDYQNSRSFSVSFTASDATTSIASVQLYYRYGSSGSFSATGSPGSGTSGSISFTAVQDGIVQFYTRATDSAGNVEAAPVSPAFDDSTTVDSVGPAVVISSPSAGFVHMVAVPVSGTASDSSGIVSVQWQVDSTAGSWTTAAGTTSWSFTTATLGQGAHTIYVKATDGAGNTQTTSVAITVQSIFAITVTQGLHGTIAPGTTDVNYDGSQDFTITPESGYHIASVTVDGSSAPATSPYTFTNVVATHTITASFAINTYAITITQTAHGTIIGPSSVNWGTDAVYSISPSNGYSIVDVVVDGVSQGAVTSATISNVKETGHSITASYALTIHSTVLTISVDPKIANKYDSPHATVSGYLKSEGTGLNLQTVIVSYNDGRNDWIECGRPTTDASGYYTVDFPVTPDFANGFVAFEAKFAGDAGNGYAAAVPVHTGAIGEEEGNLNVLPEYISGGLAAIGACFIGFAVYKKRSSLPLFKRL